MTHKLSKLLLFGVITVLVPLFVLLVPVLGYADGDHEEADLHDESSQVPIVPIEGADDFVGDSHTDHTHEIIIKGPWYQDVQWWALFLGSLILMTFLSFGVYRYLQVKD